MKSLRIIQSAIASVAALMALSSPATAVSLSTNQLLDELQYRAFRYFWEEANASNAIVKDRSASWSPGKMAATGFGLTAILIGIDHGWITREQGRARILTALQTLWSGPQGPESSGNIGYQGFFYHFVDPSTAVRTWDCELSPIDTAILFAGIIDARECFSSDDPLDLELRTLADDIVNRANWTFFYNGHGIPLGWTPESGFHPITWLGYNEGMIMYLLAIGSPTHPIPPSAWFTWTAGYQWATHYGQSYVIFPPLFGHQYTHCWFDFRSHQDIYMASRGITYFENSRRATLAARAYCIDNPLGWLGYGENIWGLTASDDPDVGYIAHGAPPGQNDNGTITPTAAASSIAFAPEIVIPALHEMYDAYGAQLWSTYGFKDAFNPTQDWFATDYIGIDQGPIVIMIENYRTGSVWDRFMQSSYVQNALALAGFQPIPGVDVSIPEGHRQVQLNASPNPFYDSPSISYLVPNDALVRLRVYDVAGHLVETLVDDIRLAGRYTITLRSNGMRSGVYYVRLQVRGEVTSRQIVRVR